jgi:hypothetical protein
MLQSRNLSKWPSLTSGLPLQVKKEVFQFNLFQDMSRQGDFPLYTTLEGDY